MWADSGWSPQSDRLAPTAPQNVLFRPALMNPGGGGGEEERMNGGISVDEVFKTPAEGYHI